MTALQSTSRAIHDQSGLPRERVSKPVRRGDIRQVKGILGLEAISRDALVVRTIQDSLECAEIMLVGHSPEPISPTDLVIDPDASGLDHPIVIHTRYRGVVWLHQLTEFVTHLSSLQFEAVMRSTMASVVPPIDVEHRREGDSDSVKQELVSADLESLWALTGDCTDALLDEDSPWFIDTDLLSPTLVQTLDHKHELVAELHHILRTRATVATVSDLVALSETGAFDVTAWEEVFPNQKVAESIVTGLISLVSSAIEELSPIESMSSPAEQISGQLSRRAGTSRIPPSKYTRLVTAPFLWDYDDDTLSRCLLETVSEGAELEILMLATSENPDTPSKSTIKHD